MHTRTNVKTSDIRIGDVVLTHGMEVGIYAIDVFEDRAWTVYACHGYVQNYEEVIADEIVPASFMRRDDLGVVNHWTVQGNDLARWCVVR